HRGNGEAFAGRHRRRPDASPARAAPSLTPLRCLRRCRATWLTVAISGSPCRRWRRIAARGRLGVLIVASEAKHGAGFAGREQPQITLDAEVGDDAIGLVRR